MSGKKSKLRRVGRPSKNVVDIRNKPAGNFVSSFSWPKEQELPAMEPVISKIKKIEAIHRYAQDRSDKLIIERLSSPKRPRLGKK